MADPIQAYPLTWPEGWKRIPVSARKNGQFNKKTTEYYTDWQQKRQSRSVTKNLTVADGVGRIVEELERMGVSRNDLIVSTNVKTRLDGMPRSGESEPKDPGAAVYWRKGYDAPMRCMAIDRYIVVADNLAAIAATLEAMRAIERHGGAEILDRAFTGFAALPAQTDGPSWWEVLQLDAQADVIEIETAFKRLAKLAHPDTPTGSEAAMQALNAAREQALVAAKGRG